MALRMFVGRIATGLPTISRQVIPRATQLVLVSHREIKPTCLGSQATQAHNARSFAVSAVQREVDSDLWAALDSEIQYEQEQQKAQPTVALEPPGDWILSEEPGSSLLTLTRKNDDETILVEFSINEQPDSADELPEDEEEGAQIDLAINFDATVVKGDLALTFDLSSDGSFLDINHVGLTSAHEEPNEDEYDGPVFSELDEKVQARFLTYLEERRVDAQLGEYLLAAADDKEQREYVTWLQQVQGFVKGKSY